MFFSRYQLIKLLRWPVNGQSYDRIDQALNRWIGVTLYYQNAWRDRETNQWVDEKFHILERIKIYSQENERSRPKPDPGQGSFEFASSFFVWNDAVYRSFTSGNIKSWTTTSFSNSRVPSVVDSTVSSTNASTKPGTCLLN